MRFVPGENTIHSLFLCLSHSRGPRALTGASDLGNGWHLEVWTLMSWHHYANYLNLDQDLAVSDLVERSWDPMLIASLGEREWLKQKGFWSRAGKSHSVWMHLLWRTMLWARHIYCMKTQSWCWPCLGLIMNLKSGLRPYRKMCFMCVVWTAHVSVGGCLLIFILG